MAQQPGDTDLASHRAAIDALDREILERLNARATHAQAIGALKAGGVVYRPEREAQVLRRLQGENRGPMSSEAVAGVFRQVMSACMALEQTLRISYLGPAGTFSHAAVAKHFGGFVEGEPCATIDDVFRAVESGQVEKVIEWSNGGLSWRFKATSMGVPFLPVRSMLNSPLKKYLI